MPTATLEKPKKPVVKGYEMPRLYTLPIRELHEGTFDPDCDHVDCDCWQDRTTDGFACIAFAEEVLQAALFPWQKWLLIHALELVDDENGTPVYRFRIVIVELARQNGKTVLATILILWHLFAKKSMTVIGTAQDLSKADDTWRDVVAAAEACDDLIDDDGNPLFSPDDIFKGHPKTFTLLNGAEYRVASATRKGGRGFSGDLIVLDELREHTNWESWSAVTNTMNARPRAQAWAFSNAGDATSVVLRYQRALAHRNLGWPDGEREFDGVLDDIDEELAALLAEMDDLDPGFFEWSAPPGAKRGDLDALAHSNPSMNHTEVTLECPTTRTLLAALASNPAYEYETEVMCRWAIMGVGGPFPEGSWERTTDVKRQYRPMDDMKKVVCVEVSQRRSQTYICRAGFAEDGTVVAGIRYDAPGDDWVVETIESEKDTTELVVVRGDIGGETLVLVEKLQKELTIPVEVWKTGDIVVAHQMMMNRLRDSTIRHYPHNGLDMAATSAVTIMRPGGASLIDIKRSPTDTAALYSMIGAVWGLEKMSAADYDVLESVR